MSIYFGIDVGRQSVKALCYDTHPRANDCRERCVECRAEALMYAWFKLTVRRDLAAKQRNRN